MDLVYVADEDGNLITDPATGFVVAINTRTNEQVLIGDVIEQSEDENENKSSDGELASQTQRSTSALYENDEQQTDTDLPPTRAENNEQQTNTDSSPAQVESFHFNHDTTLLLISQYEKNLERFCNRSVKKRNIWNDIAAEFKLKKYNVTTDELDRKWRNLKKHYVLVKDNNKKTGCGRITWPYFSRFESIYESDVSINPNTCLKEVASLDYNPKLKPLMKRQHKSSSDEKSMKIARSAPYLTESKSPIRSSSSSEVEVAVNLSNALDMPADQPVESEAEQESASPRSSVIRRKKRNTEPDWITKLVTAQKQQSDQICAIQQEVRQSNEIQKKRNDLLEKFLERM